MNKVNYIFVIGLLNTAILNLRAAQGIDSKSKFYIKFEERPLTLPEKKAFLQNYEGKKPYKLEELKVSIHYLDPIEDIDIKYISMRSQGSYTKALKEETIYSLYIELISKLMEYLWDREPSMEKVIKGTYGRGIDSNQ